jgi:CheY-like chemotaxis protein/PAS domain-containing protein
MTKRILVLDGPGRAAGDLLQKSQPGWELVRVEDAAGGLDLLQTQVFDAIFADISDPAWRARAAGLLQARRVLETLPDGIAVVNADLTILWANATFEGWAGCPTTVGKNFCAVLNTPEIGRGDGNPFAAALGGHAVVIRVQCSGNRFFEIHISPLRAPDSSIKQVVCLCRDVTAEVQQQQKLDAIHQAGSELAELSADQLAEMSVEERIEVLKLNIRKLTRDLLHYDVIEIRLLDPATGRLEPLLQEGMTGSAKGRVLYASAEGNGITGYVAATGKSYLCPDAAADPRYIEGSLGARSSLTVPLIGQDKIIGTFNVENPQLNAFGADDLKFAEILSREIAAALHTLELLSAEKVSAASQSVEAISREVALPVDEILTATTAVLEKYIGHEQEFAEKLRTILSNARAIKQSIQRVGEDITATKSSNRCVEGGNTALRGLRLLVADNDERVRRSAHGILGRFGCIVETARDGQEAITMAKLSPYDAILADIRLPDVSGYEVFHRLRQAQPKCKVILMTAYGYDPSHSIVKARQEGLRYILFKPFRVDQLIDALASSQPDGEREITK